MTRPGADRRHHETVQGRNVPRAAMARMPQAAFFYALAGPSMILNLSAWQAGACGVQDANHGLAGVPTGAEAIADPDGQACAL